MSLTLVATFNSKEDAHHAIDALVEAGLDRRAVSTTVRRELGTKSSLSPLMFGGSVSGSRADSESRSYSAVETEALKAITLVAVIGAIIGAAIGMVLVYGPAWLRVEAFAQNPVIAMIAGAIAGLAVGTYSGAVASVGKTNGQGFDQLSPYLSAKERVMVSTTVADERQDAVSKLLRQHGAFAVREWSLLAPTSNNSHSNNSHGLHV